MQSQPVNKNHVIESKKWSLETVDVKILLQPKKPAVTGLGTQDPLFTL